MKLPCKTSLICGKLFLPILRTINCLVTSPLYESCIIMRRSARGDKAFAIRVHLSAKGSSGFTLVELMVTVAILAIVIMIATPSILTQLARMEAERVKSQLGNTLALAKAESYISRQNVLVCLSNNGRRCHRNADKTLLAFIDKNDNKRFDAQTDTLLTQENLNLKYSTLKLRVGSRRHYIKFWGDSGKPRGHFGHIKYCPTSTYNQSMYQISFNQAGIIKHKRNSDHPTGC